MLAEGQTQAAIVRALGCSKSAVSYQAKKLGPRKRGPRPSYDWHAIQTYYDTWRGKPLSLELDHINGDKHDNRLENLRLLCPNCHSQTLTCAGRNTGVHPHRLAELRSCSRV